MGQSSSGSCRRRTRILEFYRYEHTTAMKMISPIVLTVVACCVGLAVGRPSKGTSVFPSAMPAVLLAAALFQVSPGTTPYLSGLVSRWFSVQPCDVTRHSGSLGDE